MFTLLFPKALKRVLRRLALGLNLFKNLNLIAAYPGLYRTKIGGKIST